MEPMEICIMCGAKTNVPVSKHVDYRIGYIEGAGQLCPDCYRNGTNRRHIAIPINMIINTPNDMELGGKVRQFYYNNED